MPFTNKGELKAQALDWMARQELAGNVDDFCRLGAAWLDRRLPITVADQPLVGVITTWRLAGDADTNWLLNNHPDIYLAAVMVYGGGFTKDFDEASIWTGILARDVPDVRRQMALARRAELTVDPALLPDHWYGLRS